MVVDWCLGDEDCVVLGHGPIETGVGRFGRSKTGENLRHRLVSGLVRGVIFQMVFPIVGHNGVYDVNRIDN